MTHKRKWRYHAPRRQLAKNIEAGSAKIVEQGVRYVMQSATDQKVLDMPAYQRFADPLLLEEKAAQRDECGEGGYHYELLNPSIKWAQLPVKVFINHDKNPLASDAVMDAEVQTALDEINETFGATLLEVSTSVTNQITVGWATLDGKGSTVAVTNYSWNSRAEFTKAAISHDLSEKWTVINDRWICGSYGDAYVFRNVLEHELLHAIGGGHDQDKLSSLWPYVTYGETLRETLANMNKQMIWDLYGRYEPIPPEPEPEPEPTPEPEPEPTPEPTPEPEPEPEPQPQPCISPVLPRRPTISEMNYYVYQLMQYIMCRQRQARR